MTVAVLDREIPEIRRRLGIDFEAYEEDGLSWVAVSPFWEFAGSTYLFKDYLYSPFPGLDVCLDILDEANGGAEAVDRLLAYLEVPRRDVRWVRAGYCSWDRSAYAALEVPKTMTLAEVRVEFPNADLREVERELLE